MSKFYDLDHYKALETGGYQLLPIRFEHLSEESYVLTNIVGEFTTIDRDELIDLVNGDLTNTSPKYQDLKSKSMLIDSESVVGAELLSIKWRTKLSRLSDFTGLHMFVVSLRCEHSCPYCQVSRQNENGQHYDMTRDTADKALDMVFKSPAPSLKIEFQGGEPLLNFPIIKYVVEKASEQNIVENRNLAFVIATNLAVVTPEILEFCEQYKIAISTSLDGQRDLHNKNRPRPGKDSYERTIAGIDLAREYLGKDQVSALMTTTHESLEQPIDIINEYINQGFQDIFLRPLSPYGFAIKTNWYGSYGTERWLDFYYEGLDYIIEINKGGFFFVERYAATILKKMLTPFEPGYVDLMSPSGIGVAAIVYNYDGDVYASDEGRMLAEMGHDTFKIGNLHKDSYQDIFLSESLLEPIEQSCATSVPMCDRCAFQPYCGADPVFHFATQGDFVGHKPTSDFCSRHMSLFKRLIKLMDDPETKQIFLRWAAN